MQTNLSQIFGIADFWIKRIAQIGSLIKGFHRFHGFETKIKELAGIENSIKAFVSYSNLNSTLNNLDTNLLIHP